MHATSRLVDMSIPCYMHRLKNVMYLQIFTFTLWAVLNRSTLRLVAKSNTLMTM